MDFPVREACDPSNPEEAFLWMLVALPGMRGGQLVMPVEYLRQVSKRVWDCGAMVICPNCGHQKEPVIKYRRPSGTDPHWLTSPGRWVSIDEPDPVPNPAREVVAKLTQQQKAELLRELKAAQ